MSFLSRFTDRLEVDTSSYTSLLSGSNQDEEEEILSFLPSLTWQERLGGCVACMALGYILSLGSLFRFKDLLQGDPTSFVIYTTVGNIISLSGSCFLSGPKTQLKKMFHESRKVATMMYLSSLLITLVVAFVKDFKGQGVVLLILICVQYVAVFWYCLSYIPFARQMASRLFGRVMAQMEDV